MSNKFVVAHTRCPSQLLLYIMQNQASSFPSYYSSLSNSIKPAFAFLFSTKMTGPSKRRSSQSRYLLETTSNVSQPGVPSDCTCRDHYECGSQQRVASTHNWFFGAHRSQPPLIPEERKVKFSACPACRKHNGEIVAKSEVKANLPGGALNMDQLMRNQYSRSSLSDGLYINHVLLVLTKLINSD